MLNAPFMNVLKGLSPTVNAPPNAVKTHTDRRNQVRIYLAVLAQQGAVSIGSTVFGRLFRGTCSEHATFHVPFHPPGERILFQTETLMLRLPK